METFVTTVGNMCYGALGLVALVGTFYVILVWRRVAQIRFRTEEEQEAFLDGLDEHLEAGDFKAATEMCDQDDRAVSQLALLAITNRNLGYRKIRTLVTDRFQRDVLADLEHRLSWVYASIKTAPMLGLYGTVLGMMGAFDNLASGQKVDPVRLASDISLALITTAIGLTIAIPLILATNSVNVRIRKLEDLVGVAMTRLMETFKALMVGSAGGRES